MKNRHATKDAQEVTSLVRWNFARNHRQVTCAVRATTAASTYEVATIPLWDIGRAAIETFKTAVASYTA